MERPLQPGVQDATLGTSIDDRQLQWWRSREEADREPRTRSCRIAESGQVPISPRKPYGTGGQQTPLALRDALASSSSWNEPPSATAANRSNRAGRGRGNPNRPWSKFAQNVVSRRHSQVSV